MNYIKKLEIENAILKETILEIRSYLSSDKFKWPNDSVNVKDILNRIDNITLWNRGADLTVKVEIALCLGCDKVFKKSDLNEWGHCETCRL